MTTTPTPTRRFPWALIGIVVLAALTLVLAALLVGSMTAKNLTEARLTKQVTTLQQRAAAAESEEADTKTALGLCGRAYTMQKDVSDRLRTVAQTSLQAVSDYASNGSLSDFANVLGEQTGLAQGINDDEQTIDASACGQ